MVELVADLGAATLPIILEYDDDFGSTSTTAMRSGDFRSGSKAAT
jgi:hypothetical protein